MGSGWGLTNSETENTRDWFWQVTQAKKKWIGCNIATRIR